MRLTITLLILGCTSLALRAQPEAMHFFKVKAAEEKRPAAIPHVITFFIERTDETGEPPPAEHTIRKITRPGTPNRLFIDNQLRRRSVQGIYATYRGWATHSDTNGQVMFPRAHQDNSLTFVVTRSLQPVLAQEKLINHFRAGLDEPVAYYAFTLNQTEEQATWNVYRIDTPVNRVIPAQAIVLIAKPDQILIHEGVFPASKSLNLVLPTIYARPGLKAGTNALHFLKVNRYFAPVHFNWRFASARYGVIITP